MDFEEKEVEHIFESESNLLSEIFQAIADKVGINIDNEEPNINFKNLKAKQIIYDYSSNRCFIDIRDSHINELIFDKPYNSNEVFLFCISVSIDKVILSKDEPDINKYPIIVGLSNARLIGEIVKIENK